MEGQKILLRNFNESDVDAVFAYRSLPEVAKYQYWEPITKEEARLFVNDYSHPRFDVSFKWNALAIILKENNELIGDCSLRLVIDKVEVGCIIAPKYQRQGLAKEALGQLINYCFANMAIDEVYGITDSKNTASIRLMESLYMLKVPDFEEKVECKDCLCVEYKYAVKKSDWKRQLGGFDRET